MTLKDHGYVCRQRAEDRVRISGFQEDSGIFNLRNQKGMVDINCYVNLQVE